MDLTLLRSFLAILDAGTVSAAAIVMNVTQPGLSRQLKKLETDVGLRLFERDPAGLRPTAAAIRMAPAVRDVVDRADGLGRAFTELVTGEGVRFRVVCPDATVRGVIAPFVAETGAAISNTHADLAARVYQRLAAREADLAVNTIEPPLGLASRLIAQAEVAVFAPTGHRLLKREVVDVQDLIGENLIVISVGSGLRAVVDHALWPVRELITLTAEPESTALAQAMAVAGVGINIDLGAAPDGLERRPLVADGRGVHMPIYAAWQRDHFAAARLEALAAELADWGTRRGL